MLCHDRKSTSAQSSSPQCFPVRMGCKWKGNTRFWRQDLKHTVTCLPHFRNCKDILSWSYQLFGSALFLVYSVKVTLTQIVPLGLKRWVGVEVIRLLLLFKRFKEISEKVVNSVHPLLDFYLNFVYDAWENPLGKYHSSSAMVWWQFF